MAKYTVEYTTGSLQRGTLKWHRRHYSTAIKARIVAERASRLGKTCVAIMQKGIETAAFCNGRRQ